MISTYTTQMGQEEMSYRSRKKPYDLLFPLEKFKPEADIQKYILKFLKSQGCYSIKTVVSNRKGIPDIHFCYHGRYYAIEVKAGNRDFRDVTALQRDELDQINNSGGFGFFTNSISHFEKIWNFFICDDFLM